MGQTKRRSCHSCDRCKLRKLACVRFNENLSVYEPCATCSALRLDCKTTIERKRRKLSVSTISKINKEYMGNILKSIYPELDVEDTDSLKALSDKLKTAPIKQPASPAGSTSSTTTEDKEVHYVVYSGKSVNDGIISSCLESTAPSTFGLQLGPFDRVIYDNDGGSHFMGSFGFTGSLTLLLNNYIKLTGLKETNSINFIRVINKRGSVISSFSDATDPSLLKVTNDDLYPLMCNFSKEESEFYVSKYFESCPKLLRAINEEEVDKLLDTFWQVKNGKAVASSLTHAQYCNIYIIWITGVSIELYPEASMQDTYESMNRYLNLIKILLSDIFLVPSTDGIRCLLLLSCFFERNMQVETSYILAQTAICHAMASGFHRESIATAETFTLWWALFDREVQLGYYFGRTPSIPLDQVDLATRKRFESSSSKSLFYDHWLTELNKLSYNFLNHEQRPTVLSNHLTREYLNMAVSYDIQLGGFFERISGVIKDFNNLSMYEAQILNQYYLTAINSGFPFLLSSFHQNISSIPGCNINDIVRLIEKCVDNCIKLVNLVRSVITNDDISCLDWSLTTVSCYTMVGLVAGAMFYKVINNTLPEIYRVTEPEKRLQDIVQSSRIIRDLNMKQAEKSTGTLRIRQYWIEILNEDLDLLLDNININPDILHLKTLILGDFEETQSFVEDKIVSPKLLDYNSLSLHLETNFLDGSLSQNWISAIFKEEK